MVHDNDVAGILKLFSEMTIYENRRGGTSRVLRIIIYNHPVWWFYRREAREVHEEYTLLVTAIIVEISATSSNKWWGLGPR